VDGFLLAVWLVRIVFLILVYGVLFSVVRALTRDLRAAAREPATTLGRFVVLASPAGEPPTGAVFPLDAVTTLGRDVNNSISIEDPFASSQHALLTYRGRGWYVEDLDSTNGTYVNGARVTSPSPVGYGDEVQIGQVRLRLERGRA
jgi:pSer/pThr/pTyr-binding forkhead associated (FHA) protein